MIVDFDSAIEKFMSLLEQDLNEWDFDDENHRGEIVTAVEVPFMHKPMAIGINFNRFVLILEKCGVKVSKSDIDTFIGKLAEHLTIIDMVEGCTDVMYDYSSIFIVAEPEKCQVFSLAYEWLKNLITNILNLFKEKILII